MKCPYAVHRKIITKCNINYDEETQQQTNWLEVQSDFAEFSECLKENCGAWYDGRCRYHGE